MVTTQPQPGSIYYPEEDDQVTESAKHAVQYANLLSALRMFFQPRADVFVGGNNFVYYQEGDPQKCFSPDIFVVFGVRPRPIEEDRKSTRLNSSHLGISYAVFCLKK